MKRVSCLLVLSLLITATRAAAMDPIPGEERFAALKEGEQNSAGAELGFGKLEEDFYLQLTARVGLNFGKLGLGLQVPLNLRVIDEDPENNNDFYGVIRYEDWNEWQKFLKVIRYVRYNHKHTDDLLFVQVGELAAEIGHGTIMTRYMNNLDLNQFRVGSQFDINTNYGGVETVVGDFASLVAESPTSRLVGGRLFVKPVAFIDDTSLLNIFAIGTSVVTDLNAPREIEMQPKTDSAGAPIVDAAGNPVLEPVIADHNLVIAEEGPQTVLGVDAEAKVINTDIIKLTPYTDLNFIGGAGWGWHLGTLFIFRFPVGFDLTIPLRLEYRRFKSDYIPAYFSTFYEIERYTYPLGGKGAAPKARAVRALPSGKGINGYYGDLAFDFAGIIQVGGIYEDYDDGDPNLALFASVPALEIIQAKAYYTRTGITGSNDIFAFDDRSMLIAEARYELIQFLYLVGRFTRRWALDSEVGSKTYGEFEPSDDWKFGIEFSMQF